MAPMLSSTRQSPSLNPLNLNHLMLDRAPIFIVSGTFIRWVEHCRPLQLLVALPCHQLPLGLLPIWNGAWLGNLKSEIEISLHGSLARDIIGDSVDVQCGMMSNGSNRCFCSYWQCNRSAQHADGTNPTAASGCKYIDLWIPLNCREFSINNIRS